MRVDELTLIQGAIVSHLAENPEDLAEVLSAAGRGVNAGIIKVMKHASDCQYAVSAMSALSSKKRVSKGSADIYHELLIRSLPNLDNTKATSDYVSELREAME